jgi:hypothetical protein
MSEKQQPRQVELTSKRLKLCQIVAVVLLLPGMLMLGMGGMATLVGAMLAGTGLLLWLYARFMSWWRHG